ncbi:RmlC-like cupin domain-containing protein [Vararia minispora EC-137]|uniref:RmlC-like cupin domain-containing protein n=1 Tax=Vararia minispora EC-137 TaxID=1314806 RepID=A0ACB8Q708_9AGAM|nr:RmlC-like cupin domain-containing protein [Vararia minispora EC-137]
MSAEKVKLIPRPSHERGHADHGWLKTFHTFAFAAYTDWNHMQFGSLRVINEDRVEPHTGFGTHGHREFEIFSYVVAGELQHKDSMGNVEVLKRGDLQMTSAGTGIRHSEHSHGDKQVHFLQIWAQPGQSGLKPQYFTRHFTDDEKKDRWAKIVAPLGDDDVSTDREAAGAAPVHAPLALYASLVSPGRAVAHTAQRHKAYLHLIQTSGYNPGNATGGAVTVSVAGQQTTLREGDGCYVHLTPGVEIKVENTGDRIAEVVLFDLE